MMKFPVHHSQPPHFHSSKFTACLLKGFFAPFLHLIISLLLTLPRGLRIKSKTRTSVPYTLPPTPFFSNPRFPKFPYFDESRSASTLTTYLIENFRRRMCVCHPYTPTPTFSISPSPPSTLFYVTIPRGFFRNVFFFFHLFSQLRLQLKVSCSNLKCTFLRARVVEEEEEVVVVNWKRKKVSFKNIAVSCRLPVSPPLPYIPSLPLHPLNVQNGISKNGQFSMLHHWLAIFKSRCKLPITLGNKQFQPFRIDWFRSQTSWSDSDIPIF
ncbi:hypothetical protein CEXT_138321 [Caerostris extrusa]|uniref:Uncharacterized protein n=1 Tax=Caerostris extrusa TaxID=172846 RepID=A0AAV4VND0_CAEEX|nr:hypothetical protein CEXT_138321 [Caerostris extrusa]